MLNCALDIYDYGWNGNVRLKGVIFRLSIDEIQFKALWIQTTCYLAVKPTQHRYLNANILRSYWIWKKSTGKAVINGQSHLNWTKLVSVAIWLRMDIVWLFNAYNWTSECVCLRYKFIYSLLLPLRLNNPSSASFSSNTIYLQTTETIPIVS